MERRLVAIFAADMVGFSRLMEADEIGTINRQKRHRTELIDLKIEQHGGRIIKLTGDGMIVEFPSVVGAVQCAVSVQREMDAREEDIPKDQKIRYRIAVNLGDVVFDDGDVYGDGVNIAARLEALAPPGGVVVSGTAYDHLKSNVAVGYLDLGEQQVKNIATPVRVYQVVPEGAVPPVQPAAPISRLPLVFGSIAIALIVLGGLSWVALTAGSPPTDTGKGRVSLAVLPFQNTGGDAARDYFVDGMTDDLTTDLSKISSLFVIARNSAFAYRGRDVPPDQVAVELGVRYILTGSVRQVDGNLRVNARLVDTESGGQVWADRFDGEMADIFALQDRVTGQIMKALAVELTPTERKRFETAQPATSAEVYDFYLRGVDKLRQFQPDTIRQARIHFLAALSRDPDFAPAHAAMAFSFVATGIFYSQEETDATNAQAIFYARRAVELDPDLPQGHFGLAMALQREARADDALAAAQRAIAIDPNYADAHAAMATIRAYAGDGEGALAAVRKATELNPRYSAAYIDVIGRAHFALGDYEAAIREFGTCIERDPAFLACHVFLAATLALTGRIADAEWEAEEVRLLDADILEVRSRFLSQFSDPIQVAQLKKGLAEAGLIETN